MEKHRLVTLILIIHKLIMQCPQNLTSLKTESILPRENIKPDILKPLLDSISAVSRDEKSHKLCVDGNKINPSTLTELGQIDLFGIEDKPTSSDLKKA